MASRRKAEEYITAGRVTVNGRVAELGSSVTLSRDRVCVDGKPISIVSSPVWLVLNKPAGFLTTKADPKGRETVFDLVDDIPGLTYVGRLDYMTDGLLLMTNDGDGAHILTHPSSEIERTYVAVVSGDVIEAARIARRGIELEDGWVHPVHVAVRPAEERRRHEFELTIKEGKNREVRRICEALGLTVHRLTRTQFGPIKLGQLPVGTVRPLTPRELMVIEALKKDPKNAISKLASKELRRPRRNYR